ncbi:MAG: hypothetical protein ACLQOO_17700 [Terriglobia bacterium]
MDELRAEGENVDMDELRPQIERIIGRLEDDYRRAPGTILTEGDLKCVLFSRLAAELSREHEQPTLDRVPGTMVHAEVRWLTRENKLLRAPDITILDPKNLSIFQELSMFLRGEPRGPLSKEFSFSGEAIIFELKFARGRWGVTPKVVRKVREDLEKVTEMFKKLDERGASNQLYCYFVIFSQVNRCVPEFDRLLGEIRQRARCCPIFGTANVTWPTKTRGR